METFLNILSVVVPLLLWMLYPLYGSPKEPEPKNYDDIGHLFYGQVFSQSEIDFLTRRDDDS